MSEIEYTWPAEQVDAVALNALNGEFEIVGTDDQQIRLEGDVESLSPRAGEPRVSGRWLRFETMGHSDENHLTLHLPRHKAWALDVSALRGQVQVREVQGRFKIMLAKGDIDIADAQGVFAVSSAKGDIRLERCREAAAPEWPAQVRAKEQPQEPAMAGADEGEDEDEGPRFRFRRHRRGRGFQFDWDWDWEQFVPSIAERMSQLNVIPEVMMNLQGMFSDVDPQLENAAVKIQSANGDAVLIEIEAETCLVALMHGDVIIERGRIGRLQVQLAKGDVQVRQAGVNGNWSLQSTHGDLALELPAGTSARLDMATRHGEIQSEIPLVRVNRPGPGARHGGRMVGTVGSTEGNPFDIHLATMHGDIQIRGPRGEHSRAESRPRAETTVRPGGTSSSRPPATPARPVPPARPAEPGEPGSPPIPPAPPQAPEDTLPPARSESASTSEEIPAAERPADPRLAVLQSLSRGEISIEEASRLLDAMH